MNSPLAGLLPDGRRLHLQHGPIDLVIEAFGPRDEIGAAYRQARTRFETVLTELVEELAVLRQPVRDPRPGVAGPTAIRMMDAVWPHRDTFVTSMAAVAGSVADEVMASLIDGRSLDKAYINNSGDISVYLTPAKRFGSASLDSCFGPRSAGRRNSASIVQCAVLRRVAGRGAAGRSVLPMR